MSSMMSAKLRLSAGAPLISSGGRIPSPSQVKRVGICSLCLNTGEVRFIGLFSVQGPVPFFRRAAGLAGRLRRFFGAVEKFRRDGDFFRPCRAYRFSDICIGRGGEETRKPLRREIGNALKGS